MPPKTGIAQSHVIATPSGKNSLYASLGNVDLQICRLSVHVVMTAEPSRSYTETCMYAIAAVHGQTPLAKSPRPDADICISAIAIVERHTTLAQSP